jgi:lysylphosphatidylglycerol synthetase-like protein (DUF2156 family)
MSFAEFFRNRHHIAQTIFILIILYTVSSINVLILALDIVPHLPGAYIDTSVLVAFAAVSLALTLVVGVYHLYTMIYRKKRRTDADDGAQ